MTDTTAGVHPVYAAALETLRRGAPGLSDMTCQMLARSINTKVALAAQPSASVEALIAEARAKMPDAGPEAIARHLYTYLAANPDLANTLWLIQGLKDVIGRERTEQSRIMGDFKDAAPGAAAVAAHDSFLRANPHLNESDPNVRT